MAASFVMEEEDEETRSPWEIATSDALENAQLPTWDSKSRAALFTQGHRGLLDFDLEFPEEYLQGPAPACYVWKIETDKGTQVHSYVDLQGNRFHLQWHEDSGSFAQSQPTHHEGPCDVPSCQACTACEFLSNLETEQ